MLLLLPVHLAGTADCGSNQTAAAAAPRCSSQAGFVGTYAAAAAVQKLGQATGSNFEGLTGKAWAGCVVAVLQLWLVVDAEVLWYVVYVTATAFGMLLERSKSVCAGLFSMHTVLQHSWTLCSACMACWLSTWWWDSIRLRDHLSRRQRQSSYECRMHAAGALRKVQQHVTRRREFDPGSRYLLLPPSQTNAPSIISTKD